MSMKQEPERGTADRKRAVRAHVERVIRIFERHHPVEEVPVELTSLRTREQPECECEEPRPRAAHGTFLCIMCAGVVVPRTTAPDLNEFPKDDIGNLPIAVREGSPIVCTTCKDAGRTIYARYSKSENKLWCPLCHKPPKGESFTDRLRARMKRSKARVQA